MREDFLAAEEEASPCVLSTYGRSKASRFSEIPDLIARQSPKKIKKCLFPYVPISGEDLTVSNLVDLPDNTTVNVVGKLCQLGKVRTVESRTQEELQLQEGYLCDQASSVRVTFWEKFIGEVEEDQSYRLKNFKLRNTTSDMFIQTIKNQSAIKPITDVGAVQKPMHTPDLQSVSNTSISVIGVEKISFNKICKNCSASIPDIHQVKVVFSLRNEAVVCQVCAKIRSQNPR